jgi:hypothetical protein
MLYLFCSLFASICYFQPPAEWELVHPKQHTGHVQVGFVGKTSTQFRPSINLATEKVDVSLKEYVKSVRQLHLEENGTSWRDLGKFSMKAGFGRLTEITNSCAWGEVKMLQALFVKEGTAYILTAAALKEDMIRYQRDFLRTLQSLQITEDLLGEKEELKAFFAGLGSAPVEEKKDQWADLQKLVIEKHPEMGSHWHFLVLKDGYAKIHGNP